MGGVSGSSTPSKTRAIISTWSIDIGEVWEIDGEPSRHAQAAARREHRRPREAPAAEPERSIGCVGFIERTMPPCPVGRSDSSTASCRAVPGGPLFIAERPDLPADGIPAPQHHVLAAGSRPGARRREQADPLPLSRGRRRLHADLCRLPGAALPSSPPARCCASRSPTGGGRRITPTIELRCYVQLSGWFESREGRRATPGLRGTTLTPGQHPEPRPNPAVTGESLEAHWRPRALLKSVFGYDDFLPLQAEIIANVLARPDTLAIMPTGGGKSLCYQLPALLFDGLTVVVSPLIALMQDQVDALRELGRVGGLPQQHGRLPHLRRDGCGGQGRPDQAAVPGARDVAASRDAP